MQVVSRFVQKFAMSSVMLVSMMAAGAAHAVTDRYTYDYEFQKSAGKNLLSTCRTDNTTGALKCWNSEGNSGGGFSMAKPAGATTAWMSFYWYSDGFFANPSTGAPGAGHFAFALRGDNDGVTSPKGRGMLIGFNQDYCQPQPAPGTPCKPQPTYASGCKIVPSAQVESFWSTGNMVWNTSCYPNAMKERTWYAVTVHVNDNHWIAYTMRELTTGATTYSTAVLDTNNVYISDTLRGWWLAHVFSPSWAWRVSITDLQTGWF